MTEQLLFEVEYNPLKEEVISEVYGRGLHETLQEYKDLIEGLKRIVQIEQGAFGKGVVTLTIKRDGGEGE